MAPRASSREFELVAACCRPLRDAGRADAVRCAAVPGLDWPHLLRLAHLHRVEPHVLDGLASAGVELPVEARLLAERVMAGAAERLALIAETLRLDAQFEAAGIDMLHFKGATLEKLAYRRTGFKQSRDIDILVHERDLDRSEGLLAELGFVCDYPDIGLRERVRTDPARRRAFLRDEKETVWRRDRVVVEIHWRLARSHFLLPGVGLAGPRQAIELLPGRAVPTLARPDLFAYLVLHGAHHGWHRLKWLADVVALIADAPSDELAALHECAAALRVGRCSAQALLLGEKLLGLRLPPEWSAQLRADRPVRSMVAFGMAVLSADVPAGREDDHPKFGGRLFRLHWQSASHWRYRMEFVARCWARLCDWVWARLPSFAVSRRESH